MGLTELIHAKAAKTMRLGEFSRILSSRIWDADPDRLSSWGKTGLRIVRICWAIGRDLRRGDLNLRAMSLVYTTILSLVPLLAFSFSVLKGFGVHEELETAMMQVLTPLGEKGVEIGLRIIEFVDNVKVGVLGSVGLVLLLYTVISLMQKIEGAFNFIWHVSRERPFAQRFSYYLSVVVIGPVLVFSSLGVSASLLSTNVVKSLTAIEPFGSLIHIGGALLPFVLVVAAFTFIYVSMPNTRVKPSAAFVGAIVAGVLWNLSGLLFASFVVSSAQYTAIYSAFAALIVFMLWLYVAWLVLLVGASVAFYQQCPEKITPLGPRPTLSARLVEKISFALLAEIATEFASPDPRSSTQDLAAKLCVPLDITEKQIEALSRAGLVCATADAPQRWIPSRAPDAISLTEIMTAIRSDGESTGLKFEKVAIASTADQVMAKLERLAGDALTGLSLADLVERRGDHSLAGNTVATLHPKRGPGGQAE